MVAVVEVDVFGAAGHLQCQAAVVAQVEAEQAVVLAQLLLVKLMVQQALLTPVVVVVQGHIRPVAQQAALDKPLVGDAHADPPVLVRL